MNIPLLTKNLTTTPAGAVPFLNIVADLAQKRGYTLNYLVRLFAQTDQAQARFRLYYILGCGWNADPRLIKQRAIQP